MGKRRTKKEHQLWPCMEITLELRTPWYVWPRLLSGTLERANMNRRKERSQILFLAEIQALAFAFFS